MTKTRKPRWDRELYDSRLNQWLRALAWKPIPGITLEIMPR